VQRHSAHPARATAHNDQAQQADQHGGRPPRLYGRRWNEIAECQAILQRLTTRLGTGGRRHYLRRTGYRKFYRHALSRQREGGYSLPADEMGGVLTDLEVTTMKAVKWTALVVSGGVMLQLGSCTAVIADLLINAVLSGLLGGLTGAV
jgi:hypothetical protein